MADTLPAGLALAVAAAVAFEGAYLLQALEARTVAPVARAYGILAPLVRRRRWLAGIALAAAGAALQVGALRLAPLTVVQPALALGVVALVVVGGRVFAEPVGPGDVIAAGVLAAGVASLAVAGDDIEARPVDAAAAAVALGGLGLVLMVSLLLRRAPPLLLVLGAGAGDALAALCAERFADAWNAVSLAWFALGALALAASLSVEMTALGRWPATRVGPFVLVGQTVVPVLLAPFVAGEHWGADGTLVVAGLGLIVAGGGWLARSGGLLESREALHDDVGGPRQREP